MNGVIYARYSCDRQTENSILGQVRECTDFARKEGIDIINIYKDEAISGRTAIKRPGFMQMIHDANKKMFDCVIVWKGDRFSRSRADAARYKGELKKLGIRVLSATEANVTGPEAILMDGINEAFAEYFSVELAAKVVRGMTQNVIEGKVNGGKMTYGYKLDENRKVIIDPEKGPIVKEAFDLYVQGNTVAGVARIFKEKGYINDSNRPFTHGGIHNMLKNERYYGKFGFKGTVNYNVFPSIISKEQFDAVQEKMLKNHRERGTFRGKEKFYLKGKVFCGYDHLPLKCEMGTSKTGKIHYYYRCAHANEFEHQPVTIKKKEFEDLIFNEMFNFYRNEKDIAQRIVDRLMDRYRASFKDIKPLKAMLANTNAKLTNLMKVIENGGEIDIFMDRIKELKETKERLEREIANAGVVSEEQFQKTMEDFFMLGFDVEMYYNDDEMKRWFVDTFINAVYLTDHEILINFKYKNKIDSDYMTLNYNVHYKNTIVHQSTLYTNTDIYCDGKLLGITIDLKPYLAKIRVMLDKKKNR